MCLPVWQNWCFKNWSVHALLHVILVCTYRMVNTCNTWVMHVTSSHLVRHTIATYVWCNHRYSSCRQWNTAVLQLTDITGYIASCLILGLSLISKFLVASIAIYLITAASDWPRPFLHPGCFCLALNLHMYTRRHMHVLAHLTQPELKN